MRVAGLAPRTSRSRRNARRRPVGSACSAAVSVVSGCSERRSRGAVTRYPLRRPRFQRAARSFLPRAPSQLRSSRYLPPSTRRASPSTSRSLTAAAALATGRPQRAASSSMVREAACSAVQDVAHGAAAVVEHEGRQHPAELAVAIAARTGVAHPDHAQHVGGALADAGAVVEQPVGRLAEPATRLARDAQHVAAEVDRVRGGDARAAALCPLHQHHRAPERGHHPVARRETPASAPGRPTRTRSGSTRSPRPASKRRALQRG